MPTISGDATRREWLGLAVLALPCILYAMDLTVLNLALPSLSAELAPSSSQTLWIVDVYGFLVAGLLVTMGNVGDRIGRRRLLMFGAAGFGIASVLAAFATTPTMLIAARALLGVAGATLAPSTLALIRNMFANPRERTVAIGVWTTSFSVGGAMGPLLGGLVLEHFHWGVVFLLAVPVMILLLVLAPVLLPEYRDPAPERIDRASVVLSLAAVLGAVYGLKRAAQGDFGLLDALVVGVALAAGAVFARRQRTLASPLVDFTLFRDRTFSVAIATFTLTTAAVFGAYVFVGQYLQLVAGLSPLEAGLWTLPSAIAIIVGSMIAPLLVRKLRPSVVLGGALGIMTVGFLVLGRVSDLGIAGVVVGAVLAYLGLGPIFTLGNEIVVGSAPPARAGAAAALSETSSELGGALGIAILGSVGTAAFRAAMARTGHSGAAIDTVAAARAAAKDLEPVAGQALVDSARHAFASAMEQTVSVCAIVTAVMGVVAVALLRHTPPTTEPTATHSTTPERTTHDAEPANGSAAS